MEPKIAKTSSTNNAVLLGEGGAEAKHEKIRLIQRAIRGVPKHSEAMRKIVHGLVMEIVNTDPANTGRIIVPQWGFRQRQLMDMHGLVQVWQYYRLPSDMSDDIRGHKVLESRPDPYTFLMDLTLPVGSAWK